MQNVKMERQRKSARIIASFCIVLHYLEDCR